MQIKNISLLLFLFIHIITFSQVKVGEWVDHTSYGYANSVAKVGDMVYSSNGVGLETYNLGDNSVEKLTKIEGLSDVGIKLIRKNASNDNLLVIYENTNIDVIKPDGKIINVSDIYRKSITGKKVIHEIYFRGNLAYLCSGFGIVVFDTERLEIKETYYIGTGIVNYEVYQVTKNDTAFFAATSKGLFYGKVNANLSFFQNWKLLNTGLPAGPYNGIINFNGTLIANYSEKLKSGNSLRDTLYRYTPTGWVKYDVIFNHKGAENKKLYDFSQNGRLSILDQSGFITYSSAGQIIGYLTNYGFDNAGILDGIYENDNLFWVADKKYGLIKSGGASWTPNERLGLNGPSNNLVNDLDIKDGLLAVAPVFLGGTFDSQYNIARPNIYNDSEWKSVKSVIPDSLFDINAVSIDPNNKNHIAFACMSSGIVEITSEQVTGVYKYGSSPLVGINGGSDVRVTGVSYDKSSKLWASITLGKKCVFVHKPDNTWVGLDFEQFVTQPTVSKIIFDKQDQAWIICARNKGLIIYKDVNNLTQPNTSNTKLPTTAKDKGNLASVDIYSLCEDKDGHIWVGTAKGISVFYNPENVFTGANWDSQQILIEQDGHVQILLENDVVTAIAVDGINRKWIGTQSSGVYCMSADGQNEIYHFTKENSPLYSNLIKDIVTDETTGDVFIGTDIGLQSYRTSIIKGFEEFTEVHAYPNPVRPGRNEPVYITGLIDETDVKITDVSGNLVWATKSQGGQVEWNLQTFSGARANTGVYMIYCASASGDKSATAKLLIVN